jgi:hypothetical protein
MQRAGENEIMAQKYGTFKYLPNVMEAGRTLHLKGMDLTLDWDGPHGGGVWRAGAHSSLGYLIHVKSSSF